MIVMNSIKLKPVLKELDRVIEFINRNTDVEDLKLQLIAEEIFVNIVNYSGATYIILNAHYDGNPQNLTLEFIDDGVKFNMLEKNDHQMPDSLDEAKVGGLGIHLIKNIADTIEYEYDGKNHLTITKKVKA